MDKRNTGNWSYKQKTLYAQCVGNNAIGIFSEKKIIQRHSILEFRSPRLPLKGVYPNTVL